MPSLTEVANLALALLGEDRVSSLSTDNSKPSRLCNEMLPQVRDRCLSEHPWNFAIRRSADLPALATAPAWGFTAAYQVPADCIRVLSLDAADPHEPWRREGNSVLCNLSAPINLRYVARITDSGAWSPAFVDLVAATLAERLAMPLAASQSARDAITRYAELQRVRARAINAAEGIPLPQYAPADAYIDARA